MFQLLKIIKALNSDVSPSALAGAVCLALFIGLTPLTSPHNLIVILLVLILRVHLGVFIMASVGFSLMGLALESQIEAFGLSVLEHPALQSFWTSLYNTQSGRLSFFNYTTNVGGFFISLILFVPLWIITVVVVKQYRQHIMIWIQKNRLVQILKSSAIIQMYNRTSGGQ